MQAKLNKELDTQVEGSRMYNLSHNCIYGTDANPRMARTSKMNPYYKDLAKDPDARYMKLKLTEKYPAGMYPLKELKENGLTSVQGRSKATVQLLQYLEKQG